MHYKSNILQCFSERGFLQNISEAEKLDDRLCKEKITAYIGFDATAPSLHVGSLLPIMMLRWWQKHGHRAIVLMGGGTTMVGDPSGRDTTRQILDVATIRSNLLAQRNVFEKFLIFDKEEQQGCIRNNADWLCDLNFLSFMREIGSHFSVSRMLSFDSVKQRIDREQHLSLLEFNYMVLQAYDFMMLSKQENCEVQMGGSDQWGNIINGMELTRRAHGTQLFGITSPLLTKADGSKMGKTAKGAVWLTESQVSSYDYWQYWRNTADKDVGRFLRLFTELPLDDIERYEQLEGSELNEAKIELANEATVLCHGEAASQKAYATAQSAFGSKQGGFDELPRLFKSPQEIEQGLAIIEILQHLGWSKSKSEARRLVEQGGVRVHDSKITDYAYFIDKSDFIGGTVRLQAGKKNHALIMETEEV